MDGRFTTWPQTGSLEKALLGRILPQDSTCSERLAKSSPDPECTRRRRKEDNGSELEEVRICRQATVTFPVPPLVEAIRPYSRVLPWSWWPSSHSLGTS